MFNKHVIKSEYDFNQISNLCLFEDICKGRRGSKKYM